MEQAHGISIKNQMIGYGKPIICVPVVAQQEEAIIKEVQHLVEKKVRLIEWRIDWFLQAQDLSAVEEVLRRLQSELTDTILLATFRTKEQGGQIQPEKNWLQKLYELIADQGLADLLDVEFAEWENPDRLIRQMKQGGVYVIASHHDFKKTPSVSKMKQMLKNMADAGADIVKLAVMPAEKTDVINLLEATALFKEEYPMTPAVTMSMGNAGIVSRVSGEIFGSCITFGSHEQPSAPGQLQMDKLETILTYLHEAYQE